MQDCLDDESESLILLFASASRTLLQALSRRLQRLDLTPSAYWIVKALFKTPGLSIHDLAELTGTDDPGASRLVERLRRRGILEVGNDPSHGRRKRVTLTEPGLQLAAQACHLGRQFRQDLEQALPEEDKRRLRSTLETLTVLAQTQT